MIRTRNILCSIRDIPSEFIFESYLKLNEKLIGQEIAIRSPFTNEKNPSFTMFFDAQAKQYFYKCFSSGFGGTALDFAQRLNPALTKGQVISKLLQEYDAHLKGSGHTEREYKKFNKYEVASFTLRNWNSLDAKYWGRYHIPSKLLERYNIAPIDHYVLSKEENGETKTLDITRSMIYGFFKKDGSLYKIYQPGNDTCKYFKIQSHIAGWDQLKFESDYLVLNSGLKDGVSFVNLDIPNYEMVAPDSENVLLTPKQVEMIKPRYKKIFVMFDMDEAGLKAMEQYVLKYKFTAIKLDMGVKDLSDCTERFGVQEVKTALTQILCEKLLS